MNKTTRPDDLVNHANLGLTKREYFAAMVLQGIVAHTELNAIKAAKCSVFAADALIEELNKETAGE